MLTKIVLVACCLEQSYQLQSIILAPLQNAQFRAKWHCITFLYISCRVFTKKDSFFNIERDMI